MDLREPLLTNQQQQQHQEQQQDDHGLVGDLEVGAAPTWPDDGSTGQQQHRLNQQQQSQQWGSEAEASFHGAGEADAAEGESLLGDLGRQHVAVTQPLQHSHSDANNGSSTYDVPMHDDQQQSRRVQAQQAQHGPDAKHRQNQHHATLQHQQQSFACVQESDLYRMKELIRENPHDVIQFIEEEGVAKLGEFAVQDYLVLKALGSDTIVTCGTDHLDCDWHAMWRDLLSQRQSTARSGWSKPVRVEAHVVTIRDAAAQGPRGLLQPLLKRYQAGAATLSVFGLPAVHAVISFKWHAWARRFLVYELSVYMIWLVSFTAFTLLYEHEDEDAPLDALLATQLGQATVCCNCVAVAAMMPFLYMEVCTILVYQAGWLDGWNLLDISCYVMQVVIWFLHMTRAATLEQFPLLLSLQHILLWSKLHFWARALTPTKSLLVDTIRIVVNDLKFFLTFMGLTMLGSAFAFYSLYRQDREESMDFTNFWHAIASMVSYILAMFDFNLLYAPSTAPAVLALFVAYEVVCYICLLNVMVAIMTSSFTKQTQDEGLRWLYSKAQIIDELEATLPNWLKRKWWFPPFVHVLKMHPTSAFDHVSLSSVLTGIGTLESNLLSAHNDMRVRMEAAEARINESQARLEATSHVLHSLLRAAAARQEQHQQQQQEEQQQERQTGVETSGVSDNLDRGVQDEAAARDAPLMRAGGGAQQVGAEGHSQEDGEGLSGEAG